jgi:hypothetical protein
MRISARRHAAWPDRLERVADTRPDPMHPGTGRFHSCYAKIVSRDQSVALTAGILRTDVFNEVL